MRPSPAIYQTIAEKRREKAQATIKAMHREKLMDLAYEAGALTSGEWWPELAPLDPTEREAVKEALGRSPHV
jgi:hypothetical protein